MSGDQFQGESVPVALGATGDAQSKDSSYPTATSKN
jgi:hypothetical protein